MVTTIGYQIRQKSWIPYCLNDSRWVPLSFFTQLFEYVTMVPKDYVDYDAMIAYDRPPFCTPLADEHPRSRYTPVNPPGFPSGAKTSA